MQPEVVIPQLRHMPFVCLGPGSKLQNRGVTTVVDHCIAGLIERTTSSRRDPLLAHSLLDLAHCDQCLIHVQNQTRQSQHHNSAAARAGINILTARSGSVYFELQQVLLQHVQEKFYLYRHCCNMLMCNSICCLCFLSLFIVFEQ